MGLTDNGDSRLGQNLIFHPISAFDFFFAVLFFGKCSTLAIEIVV